ncbi:hypothetical protein [Nesterenkonia pannonica]|uniref:hypothetical protein n=1 Tax=Nesterenkonia pannonica TaxID=1548602 RepID=UPI00216486EE|nr:hypothetical protein [Nesterenkonia pannonica]
MEWSYEPADDPWSEDGELSVRIGGEEQSGALAGEEISGSFIASVAEGDALVLSAHGVEQEISLAEGEATDPEAAALFHLPEIPTPSRWVRRSSSPTRRSTAATRAPSTTRS